jgi:hypothetical protein
MLRSYDDQDMKCVFHLLNILVIKCRDYESRIMSYRKYWNDYCLNDEWNPNLQARYLNVKLALFSPLLILLNINP